MKETKEERKEGVVTYLVSFSLELGQQLVQQHHLATTRYQHFVHSLRIVHALQLTLPILSCCYIVMLLHGHVVMLLRYGVLLCTILFRIRYSRLLVAYQIGYNDSQ